MKSLFFKAYLLFLALLFLAFLLLYSFTYYSLKETLNRDLEHSLKATWEAVASLFQEEDGFQYDEEVFSTFSKGSGNYLLVMKEDNVPTEVQPSKEVLEFPKKEGFFVFRMRDRLIAGYVNKYRGYTIGVYKDVSAYYSLLIGSMERLALGWVLLLIIYTFLAYPLWRLSLRSIDRLALRIKTSKPEKLQTIEEDLPSELVPLVKAYNQLVVRLRSYLENQRFFFYHLSHEMKTPLSIIKASTDLALGKPRNVQEMKDLMVYIRDAVDRASQTLNKLLLLYRLGSGELSVERTKFDLKELLEDVLRELAPFVEQRSVSLSVRVSSLRLEADRELARAMLMQVLENAVKYGGEKVDVFLEGRCLVIRDSGMGMHEEEIKRVFEPFYRGEQAKSQDGSGLGLSVAKAIADIFGWSIAIESQKSVGTTVRVCF